MSRTLLSALLLGAALIGGPRALGQDDSTEVSGALDPDWVQAFDWRSLGPANMGGRIVGLPEAKDLLQVTDVGEIAAAVDSVLADNPDAIDKIRGGDMKPIGFLMGQVMRVTGGKADPKVVQSLLRDKTRQ